jgi:hypothetical protein
VSLSSEFQLAIECCRRNFRGGGAQGGIALAANIDWDRFLGLAQFHRIEGLAWKSLSANLSELPAKVRVALSEAASSIAAQNLQASAECRVLRDRFEEGGVPLLFLKGLALGAIAYGNSTLKAAIDVDLLIDPADLGKAAGLMRECGYHLAAPSESPKDELLRSWHRRCKESVWTRDRPRLQIDLHTQAADNRHIIPSINVNSMRQSIDVGDGNHLPTLADEELFTYLAVHGASSAWFRLKWLSDFAAFLHGASAQRIDRFYRRSLELGAGRSAGQGLLLADELFGSLKCNADLRDELRQDRATRQLYATSLRLLKGDPREPTRHRFGTLPIHWTQFLLLPGWGFKFSELSRQAGRLFNRPPT